MSGCQTYCDNFASLWPETVNPYHFIKAHAKIMPHAVLAKKMGEPKECFKNASRLALRNDALIYCEGFAIADIGIQLPLEHAWLLSADDQRVVETTWDKPGLEYFGIAFTRHYLARALCKRKYYGLINAFDADFPLLKMTPDKLAEAIHPTMKTL